MAKKTAFDKQREAKQKAKQSTSTGRGRSTSKKTTKVRSSSAVSAQKKAGSGAKGQEVRQAPKFQVKETVGRDSDLSFGMGTLGLKHLSRSHLRCIWRDSA